MGADVCSFPDYCIEMEFQLSDGVTCLGICSAQCPMEDLWCDNGMDENGCWMGNYCMPDEDGEGNVSYCILALFLSSYKTIFYPPNTFCYINLYFIGTCPEVPYRK